MAERVQTCKDCDGRGWFYYLWSEEPRNCPTCDGTGQVHRVGPYRLQDGSWSDGVDSSKPINLRATSSRWEVTAGMNASHVWHKADPIKEFATWEEAIAYADKAARAKQ